MIRRVGPSHCLVGHKGLDQSIQAKRYIRFSFPSEFTPTYKFTVRFRPHLYLSAPFPQAIFKVLIQMQYHIVTVTPPRQISSTFMFKQTRATTFRRAHEKASAKKSRRASSKLKVKLWKQCGARTTSRRGKKKHVRQSYTSRMKDCH